MVNSANCNSIFPLNLIMNKRQFLQTMPFLGLSLNSFAKTFDMNLENYSPENIVKDEYFWQKVRNQFFLDDNFIDLRANSASSIPRVSMNKFSSDFQFIQAMPSYRNSEMNDEAFLKLRGKIAKQINCSEKEIAIMRNTTEALNNAIFGIPMNKGDEVIASVHEYDSMMGSFYQRKLRDGIVIKNIEIPYKITDSKEVVALFEKAITPKTKVFLISQIIWISGQIYPIKEICELAKKHNILTIVDAAQSFSHIPIDVQDLSCDYLGTSLHKWSAAPLGTGFLYIKRDLIPKTFPLFAHYVHKPDDENIEKFENFGSITPVFSGAIESLDFWEKLGFDLKVKRMQYLKMYWTERLKQNPKIEIVTNTNEKFSCGIAFFKVKGKSSTAISKTLRNEHKIIVPIIENYKNLYVDYGDVNIVGIATPVYVTTRELDKFIQAIEKIA